MPGFTRQLSGLWAHLVSIMSPQTPPVARMLTRQLASRAAREAYAEQMKGRRHLAASSRHPGADLRRHPGALSLRRGRSDGRLSRDQEDIAGLYKSMAYSDVKIITLSEGEVTHLHVGLRAR